jgi:NNP family nitrate/nitrite transporter-like MFS transporter
MGTGEPVPFTFSSLWGPAVLNPLNHKSLTLPILNLRSAHARNFHLSWLGFMVAL